MSSAVGATAGTYNKKDGRSDDFDTLYSRLIDRSLRSNLEEGWNYETQLLTWLLSYNKINRPGPLAICAASAALAISEVIEPTIVLMPEIEINQ